MIEALKQKFPNNHFECHVDYDVNRKYIAMDGEMIGTSFDILMLQDKVIEKCIYDSLVCYIENHKRIYNK